MPSECYDALVEEWSEGQRRIALRNAELCATIMNQPVFGYKRDGFVTAEELMGEPSASGVHRGEPVGSPAALVEFIKLGAAVQRKQEAARA